MMDARTISAQTRIYCLIGDPVSHSHSPFILNRAFAEAGIDCAYVAFRVPSGALRDAVVGLRALGAEGANVTFPHKEAVARLVDRRSTCVQIVHAANTVVITPEGLAGHNTDATGVVTALEAFAECPLEGKRGLIFGAGAAARAAAFGLLRAKASSVVFCARDRGKAAAATAPLMNHFGESGVSVISTAEEDLDARRRAVAASEILINATPLGMPGFARWNRRGLVDDPVWITPRHVCFDLVYGAGDVGFFKDAAGRGAKCLNGLSLLVAQASEALRVWTGEGFDIEKMRRATTARGLPGHGAREEKAHGTRRGGE